MTKTAIRTTSTSHFQFAFRKRRKADEGGWSEAMVTVSH